jgi:aspartyl-tRNA(Asn)/glutamyl-tRNA(Gln) amidotransferase subunit C
MIGLARPRLVSGVPTGEECRPVPDSSSTISRAEVAHLARLARLALSDDELDRFAGQLDVILQSVARVGEVAAEDIPPTSHSVPLTNVLREDVVVPCLTPEEALAGAPDAYEGRFRVPRILDEEV